MKQSNSRGRLFKKADKILFGKVDFGKRKPKVVPLVLLCAGVFGISFFAGVESMGNYNEKTAQIFYGESILAAESQKSESTGDAEKNASLKEKKVSEAMSGAADSVKNLAGRVVRARRLARQRAADTARILSGPVPTGPTKGLPDGRRVCTSKSDHPQSGGELHVDEDCCPDHNEYPNPRCHYTSGQLSHILKPPK